HPEPMTKCPYDANTNISGTSASCADLYAMQSNQCMSYCGPLTPNGCDCFGCCELPAGGGKYVWVGSEDEATGRGSCTIANLADPSKCEPWEPVAGCLNTCQHWELCIGKTELPPDCVADGGTGSGGGDGGTTQQCPSGVQPCGLAGELPCPS